jgi:hypothetical protein
MPQSSRKLIAARVISLLATVLMHAPSTLAQSHSDYTLSVVARTGDAVENHRLSYLGSPAINNRGQIAFTARLADLPEPACPWVAGTALCNSAIVTGTHILRRTGDTIEKQTLSWIADPIALNDSGTIAFAAGTKASDSRPGLGQHAIFTQNDLVVQPGDNIEGCTIAEVGSSEKTVLDPRPAIDQQGTVFFSAIALSPCRRGAVAYNLLLSGLPCGGWSPRSRNQSGFSALAELAFSPR